MITIKGLSKRFQRKRAAALADFSLDLAPGEVVGLVGENGAGKTTALRLLATLIKPTAGEAVVFGHSLRRSPQKVRSMVGLLLGGNHGLYERLTARENFYYFGRLSGLSGKQIRQRVELLSRILAMADYLDRYVGQFSQGMRQKSALLRTVMHEPKLILLDEPTSGLDLVSRRMILELVLFARRQGKSVILSSHNIEEIQEACDRILILHKGSIVENMSSEFMHGLGHHGLEKRLWHIFQQ